jgi:ribosomal protein S9
MGATTAPGKHPCDSIALSAIDNAVCGGGLMGEGAAVRVDAARAQLFVLRRLDKLVLAIP